MSEQREPPAAVSLSWLRAKAARGVRLIPVLVLDALLVVASYAAALALRFDGAVARESMVFFGQVIGVIVLAYLVGNYFFGIYRTAWQYASVADAMSLASAVGLVSILLLGVNSLLTPRPIPLTVTGIAPALIFLAMGVAKLWPRLRAQAPFANWGGPVKKRGMRIHGVAVLGDRHDIRELVRSRHIDAVALAMPSAPGATIRDYV